MTNASRMTCWDFDARISTSQPPCLISTRPTGLRVERAEHASRQEEEEGPASPWYATSTGTDLDSLLGSIPEEGESRLHSGAQLL